MKETYEIERKYLIKKPIQELLINKAGRVLFISQSYIENGSSIKQARIRKITENNKSIYILTEKKDINAIKRFENEHQISKTEYDFLFNKRLKNNTTIQKTRYCINENGYIYEVDIFPFFKDTAILEIELPDENIVPIIPEYFTVIKEVTEDKSFTNFEMSKHIPDEELFLNNF